MITHEVFSLGLGLFLAYRVWRPPEAFLLILVVWLALATNEVIDVLGHVTKGGRPVRSFWTHSVFTAPVWGITTALLSAYVLDIVFGQPLTAPQAFFAAALGTALAYSHLFLDVFTEGECFS